MFAFAIATLYVVGIDVTRVHVNYVSEVDHEQEDHSHVQECEATH
jgi:hypothetical protein